MMRRLLLASLLAFSALPAQAVPNVPPEADRLLWCGNAFYWLAADASDSGDEREADQYQGWSDELLDRAATLLAAAGLDATATDDLIETYADRALEEMASSKAPYDVTTICPTLVTP
jgi:hypothetical protein